jgi:hypothetical protein
LLCFARSFLFCNNPSYSTCLGGFLLKGRGLNILTKDSHTQTQQPAHPNQSLFPKKSTNFPTNTMDFVNKLSGGGDNKNDNNNNNQEQGSNQNQQSTENKESSGGFLGSIGDKFNSAAGGGKESEKNEDYLDKGIDLVQQHALGQGPQDNESAVEQAKDEQISDFIRGQYKGATGSDIPIKDKETRLG